MGSEGVPIKRIVHVAGLPVPVPSITMTLHCWPSLTQRLVHGRFLEVDFLGQTEIPPRLSEPLKILANTFQFDV